MVPSPRRLRRAASIVCYWRDGKLVFENYRTRVLISADPVVARLLHHFSKWEIPAQVCSRVSEFTPSSVQSTLRQLTQRGFLVREGSSAAYADAKFQESWAPWLPAGGLLHFSTKDLPYVSDLGESRRALLVQARREPAPPEVGQRQHRVRRPPLPGDERRHHRHSAGKFRALLSLASKASREYCGTFPREGGRVPRDSHDPRANVQQLVEFTTKAEKNSGARSRLLWSESEENLAQKLIMRLQKVQ